MQSEFWHERWQTGRIGFHLDRVNPFLQNYWSQMTTSGKGQVLVPLCGKSLDMLWLREQGHDVIGVELSELACNEFFSAQGVDVSVASNADFSVREVDGLALWCGDFFKLPESCYDNVSWVYDRAALIALPAEMRKQYAAELKLKLPTGVSVLLVTLEFESAEGPPFAVSEAEVRALYEDRFSVKRLAAEQMEGRGGRQEIESVYLLRDR